MNKQAKRQEKIIDGLSPEEKARLVIEDQLRAVPTLSSAERRRMVNAMGSRRPRSRLPWRSP